jgi:anaerobic C4-dicarboxylate transporter
MTMTQKNKTVVSKTQAAGGLNVILIKRMTLSMKSRPSAHRAAAPCFVYCLTFIIFCGIFSIKITALVELFKFKKCSSDAR